MRETFKVLNMSFWIYGKDKNGRQSVKSVYVSIELIMVGLACVFGLIGPKMLFSDLSTKLLIASAMVAVGYMSILGSKIPQLRRGGWYVFGMKYMGLGSKVFYVLGYALMIIGLSGMFAMYRGAPQ